MIYAALLFTYLFTSDIKMRKKIKHFLLWDKSDHFVIRGKGLQLCIMELRIRPNYSD